MATFPFIVPKDRNGTSVLKFLDAYEAVRFRMDTEPKYYGYLNPDGKFCIVQHSNNAGDEHLMFYHGADDETLSDKWAIRDTLTYKEYDEAY